MNYLASGQDETIILSLERDSPDYGALKTGMSIPLMRLYFACH